MKRMGDLGNAVWTAPRVVVFPVIAIVLPWFGASGSAGEKAPGNAVSVDYAWFCPDKPTPFTLRSKLGMSRSHRNSIASMCMWRNIRKKTRTWPPCS